MAYIYKITNKSNGKIYVGKTEFSVEKRFKEHCSDAFRDKNRNRPLYAAMRKYGIENFEVSLIEETDNPEEREIFWIEYLGSFKYGYNATIGGDGRKYIDYDLVVSEYKELKNIRRVAEKLNISADSVSKILKLKNIETISGGQIVKNIYSKVIKMFDLNNNYIQSFSSVKDAARYLIAKGFAKSGSLSGIGSHIRECANKKRITAYRHIWKWE